MRCPRALSCLILLSLGYAGDAVESKKPAEVPTVSDITSENPGVRQSAVGRLFQAEMSLEQSNTLALELAGLFSVERREPVMADLLLFSRGLLTAHPSAAEIIFRERTSLKFLVRKPEANVAIPALELLVQSSFIVKKYSKEIEDEIFSFLERRDEPSAVKGMEVLGSTGQLIDRSRIEHLLGLHGEFPHLTSTWLMMIRDIDLYHQSALTVAVETLAAAAHVAGAPDGSGGAAVPAPDVKEGAIVRARGDRRREEISAIEYIQKMGNRASAAAPALIEYMKIYVGSDNVSSVPAVSLAFRALLACDSSRGSQVETFADIILPKLSQVEVRSIIRLLSASPLGSRYRCDAILGPIEARNDIPAQEVALASEIRLSLE